MTLTQVRLVADNKWTVGFVDSRLAVKNARLLIGQRVWMVQDVYSTYESTFIAWAYRAKRLPGIDND